MSPEQCRGRDLDRRSDVYALGILLYELTTGIRLYSSVRDGDFETMRQIVEDPVAPPSYHRPDYPAELEAVVLRCLQKRPEDRYQTAQDVQEAVEEFVRRNRLRCSSIELSRYMLSHFDEHAHVFERAAGDQTLLFQALADKHRDTEGQPQLATEYDHTVPVSEQYDTVDEGPMSERLKQELIAMGAEPAVVDSVQTSGIISDSEPARTRAPSVTSARTGNRRPYLVGGTIAAVAIAVGLTVALMGWGKGAVADDTATSPVDSVQAGTTVDAGPGAQPPNADEPPKPSE